MASALLFRKDVLISKLIWQTELQWWNSTTKLRSNGNQECTGTDWWVILRRQPTEPFCWDAGQVARRKSSSAYYACMNFNIANKKEEAICYDLFYPYVSCNLVLQFVLIFMHLNKFLPSDSGIAINKFHKLSENN